MEDDKEIQASDKLLKQAKKYWILLRIKRTLMEEILYPKKKKKIVGPKKKST